jgi:hypothetical protein
MLLMLLTAGDNFWIFIHEREIYWWRFLIERCFLCGKSDWLMKCWCFGHRGWQFWYLKIGLTFEDKL